MDYAFGEQAFETIDELLKPYKVEKKKTFLNVESVSIMGKAGILEGGKGDIMIAELLTSMKEQPIIIRLKTN